MDLSSVFIYILHSAPIFWEAKFKVSVSEQLRNLWPCVLGDLSPVRWSHPDVPTQPPSPGAVGVSGQHALSAAQVVGAVGHRNLHQPGVGRHKQQTLQGRKSRV